MSPQKIVMPIIKKHFKIIYNRKTIEQFIILTKQYIEISLKHEPLRKCAFTFLGSFSIISLKSSNACSYFFNFKSINVNKY